MVFSLAVRKDRVRINGKGGDLMNAALPIFPTSVVGSHAKMGRWYLMRQEAEAGQLGSRDIGETEESWII